MRMELTSPRTTAFIHTLAWSPSSTSPITWAEASTYTRSPSFGTMFLKGRIMRGLRRLRENREFSRAGARGQCGRSAGPAWTSLNVSEGPELVDRFLVELDLLRLPLLARHVAP